jgi:hypothetical protein
MSTYDAYNLSLRDSTEFTVPTGGSESGSSGRLDIFKIKIRINPNNYSVPSGAGIRLACCMIFDENIGSLSLKHIGFFETSDLPVTIPFDNEWHEIEIVAVDGQSAIYPLDPSVIGGLGLLNTSNTIDTTHFNENDQKPYFLVTGDGSIDYEVINA